MNKKEYILKLRGLKAIIDELLLSDYNKSNLSEKLKREVIVPIWRLVPSGTVKWKLFITNINGSSFTPVIELNNTDGTFYPGEATTQDNPYIADDFEWDEIHNWKAADKIFMSKNNSKINDICLKLNNMYNFSKFSRITIYASRLKFMVDATPKK